MMSNSNINIIQIVEDMFNDIFKFFVNEKSDLTVNLKNVLLIADHILSSITLDDGDLEQHEQIIQALEYITCALHLTTYIECLSDDIEKKAYNNAVLKKVKELGIETINNLRSARVDCIVKYHPEIPSFVEEYRANKY